jgi:hypothetical protein
MAGKEMHIFFEKPYRGFEIDGWKAKTILPQSLATDWGRMRVA